jgi:hypothetical protein
MKSEVSENWQRHRTTPQERAAWVRRFERSGLTRQEFAERHGLGLSTLDRWRARESSVLARTPPALREVSVSPLLGPPQWAAEVQHPDGRIVRLGAVALPLVEALLTSQPC